MQHLWPWLAVAAAGALHGLNPATGWIFAASGVRAIAPIAMGHLLALCIGALAVPAALQFGLEIDRLVLPGLAAGWLLVLAVLRWKAGGPRQAWRLPGRAGMALCSFTTSTAHGAGWMLVPALIPLCAGDMPGREITASGSILLVLAAAGVHMAALLATTAVMATLAPRAFAALCRRLRGAPGPASG